MASRDILLGDPDAAFAEADGTVSGVREVGPHHRRVDRAARLRRLLGPLRRKSSRSGTRRRTRTRCAMYLAEDARDAETSIRVIQPHVGGAFGLKMPTFQEEPLVAYLSMQARPAGQVDRERGENFLAGGHARDTRFRYEAAYKNDGTVTGHQARGDRRRRRADRALRLGHVVRHVVLPAVRLQVPELGDAPALGRHEQVPVERVPRLRQGRRLVPHGPDHGSHREGDRPRPGRGPVQELHPAGRVPLSRRSPGRCSTAATTPARCRRSSTWSTTRASRSSRRRPGRKGAASGSGSRWS